MTSKYLPSMTLQDLDELQYAYDERAGIMEFDGGMSRTEAEQLAAEGLGFLNKEALDFFIWIRREEIERNAALGWEEPRELL